MQKGIFVVHLFILQKVLIIYNQINCSQRQLYTRTAILGDLANVIKSVNKLLEDKKSCCVFTNVKRNITILCRPSFNN